MKNKKVLKIAFIIVVLSFGFFIIYYRVSHYNYDTTLDYQYNFDQSDSQKIKLQLIDGNLTLPELNSLDQTVFLKIKINTGLFGKLIKPSVGISTSDHDLTHYFEYGAKGFRYLNISNLINTKTKNISIDGNWMHIDDQEVDLILLKNNNIDNAKILFIAPHPDDAEIAGFSLFSKYPKKSYIITITAGEAGYKKYNSLYKNHGNHSIKKGEIRTWNSIVIPLLSGVPINNSLNLGFFDSTLRTMYNNKLAIVSSKSIMKSNINIFRKLNISILKDSLNGTSNWGSLVNNLKVLIKKIDPKVIVSPHPQIDSHPDHLFSTIAVIQALKELKMNKGFLFLYTNHYNLSDLYPFGDEGDPITLPPYFEEDLYFKSVFSSPLTLTQQKDKIFSLDAMNDLRPGPEWRSSFGLLNLAVKSIIKDIVGLKNSYYKKSIRSNELFFVVPINKIELNELLKASIIK